MQSVRSDPSRRRLSRNVPILGCVSMLNAMSSAMIYGLLPVFLVQVIGTSMIAVGMIEGLAEAANSLIRIFSGVTSDWIRRRKPLVLFGYGLSALIKVLFPLAETASTVMAGRVIDRLGKGIRDAPRDAFLADIVRPSVRGSGFGLRLALAIVGYVVGPLAAIALMRASGDDYRLVFWVALIPAYLSIVVLIFFVREKPLHAFGLKRPSMPIRRSDIAALPSPFWWIIAVASVLSLAQFSQAFLVLKAHEVGLDVAFVPIMLAVTYLVYSATAYPFGMLSDFLDRRVQLTVGAVVLIGADMILATAGAIWWAIAGAVLWGLHLGITRGLLGAAIADAAPAHMRGTAFGVHELATGIAAFVSSAGAGILWAIGGSVTAFGAGAMISAILVALLIIRPLPLTVGPTPTQDAD